MSKEDLLNIYLTVLKKHTSGNCSADGGIAYLNPFAHLTHPIQSVDAFTNYNCAVLPEELTEVMPCFRFAFWEDVFDGEVIKCGRLFFTLTAPQILPNGTVRVIEGFYQIGIYETNIGYSPKDNEDCTWYYAGGNLNHLAKTAEGDWTITYSRGEFNAHN